MTDSFAVQRGRKGGLKGGPARAAKLSPERRKAIAQKAAMFRWNKTHRVEYRDNITKAISGIKERILNMETELEKYKTALNIIETLCLASWETK